MQDISDSRGVPPVAAKRPTQITCHGYTITDDYGWLRADNWQDVMRDPALLAPEIRAYLDAENAYADAALADTEALQRRLFEEMKGRIKEDDSSVPAPDGGYAYYVRYREGGQHPLICRQPRGGGEETVMLDGDALAAGKAFFQIGGTRHAPDHSLLAWSADEAGAEFYTLRVRRLDSGSDLADVVPDSTGSVVWTADATAFYYVRLDRNHRPSRVYRHVLGTPIEDDVLVYEEKDSGFFVSISELQCGAWATIDAHDHQTSEVRLLDLTRDAPEPILVAERETGIEYDVELHPTWRDGQPTLIIRSNAGAEDFEIVTAPLVAPGRANWRPLVPHRAGRTILSVAVLQNWMVRLEREDGLPRIVVQSVANGDEHAIAFAEEAYSLGMDAGFEFATDLLRFTYSSMTTPSEVWDYDLATRQRTLRKRQEIPSGHDPSQYETRRIFAAAADGEMVPISLLWRKGTPQDGTAPCLLYGYGAYGITIPAAFSGNRLSLVDRGFIYAIAHVRGGADKGRRWYRTGKLKDKPNTFSDFIAAAEHLIAQRFTSAGRIVAHGGSAGGMLMGAVANMRPDLFAGIVAEVPFVDVLNTMLDDTLPLTPPEWPEWGNPIVDAEAFATIRAYSPYDNVRAQAYPAILALAGLTDPRVTYWEPAKWVARLRAVNTGAQPIVLKTNMDAGHAGAAGRFDRLKEVALAYAFAIKVVGAATT